MTTDHPQFTMPQFYELPAHRLIEGLSTDDGQDILSVAVTDTTVQATVYTSRPDDLVQDAENRREPETRMYRPDDAVGLAVFSDTAVDGRSRA